MEGSQWQVLVCGAFLVVLFGGAMDAAHAFQTRAVPLHEVVRGATSIALGRISSIQLSYKDCQERSDVQFRTLRVIRGSVPSVVKYRRQVPSGRRGCRFTSYAEYPCHLPWQRKNVGKLALFLSHPRLGTVCAAPAKWPKIRRIIAVQEQIPTYIAKLRSCRSDTCPAVLWLAKHGRFTRASLVRRLDEKIMEVEARAIFWALGRSQAKFRCFYLRLYSTSRYRKWHHLWRDAMKVAGCRRTKTPKPPPRTP